MPTNTDWAISGSVIRTEKRIIVKNSYCTIAIDGWSTRSHEHVIDVSLHSGGKFYVANTINASGEPHTIESCQNY